MGGYWSKEVKEIDSVKECNNTEIQSTSQNPQSYDFFIDYVKFSELNPIEWGDKQNILIENVDIELLTDDESKIYTGRYNNYEIIAKVTKGDKKNDELQCLKYLNIFHPEIAPTVYTFFKDLQGQEVIIMEKLEPFVYSNKNANILRSYIRRLQESKLYHGDITPENIMQNIDGVPKLINFATYHRNPFYSQIKGIDEKYKDWQSLDRSLLQYKYSTSIHIIAKMDLQLLIDNQCFVEMILNSDEFSILMFLNEQKVQLNLIYWKKIYSMTQKYFLAIDFLKQKKYPYLNFFEKNRDSSEFKELCKYLDSIHISDEQFLEMVKSTV